MSSDKYFEKFKSLCSTGTDDDNSMRIDELRRIILYRSSNGACPANMILSKDDGSFLPVKQVCNDKTYAVVKKKAFFQIKDMDVFGDKARQTEVQMMATKNSKCVIGKRQQRVLDELVVRHQNDCKAFRKSVLASGVDLVAIHVCRWDGSPRKSVAEIQNAICLYPSHPNKLFWIGFIKFMLVVTGYLAVSYYAYKKLEEIAINDHFSKIPIGYDEDGILPWKNEFEQSLANKKSPRNFNVSTSRGNNDDEKSPRQYKEHREEYLINKQLARIPIWYTV
jgi:hypothetical protein